MGPCCCKEDDEIDDYNAIVLRDRQIQLFDILRFLRSYFPHNHPLICTMANVINEFHEVINEPEVYLNPSKTIYYNPWEREDINYLCGLLSNLKPWINNYGEHLSLAYTELLRLIFNGDYR